MIVNRNYNIPGFVNGNTLAVISSYSGNTEETLSAFKEAREKKCRILCITSGGEVERIANENNIDVLKIPGGLQPRCALGYSFFSLLIALTKLGLIEDKSSEINATIKHLQNLSDSYSKSSAEHNHPIMIAEELKDHLPVIYSSSDVMDAVNLRWQGQISENAEILAYGNYVPEMNHNELVGWNLNKDILSEIVVILLCDRNDHERVKLRMKITTDIYKQLCNSIIAIESDAESRLERIFEITYLGDWMSFYLAIMNEVDPTPVDSINYLKNKLAESN
jgi:glucose/mannose-6-phosphate isomerase